MRRSGRSVVIVMVLECCSLLAATIIDRAFGADPSVKPVDFVIASGIALLAGIYGEFCQYNELLRAKQQP